jgi:hypothetical protein
LTPLASIIDRRSLARRSKPDRRSFVNRPVVSTPRSRIGRAQSSSAVGGVSELARGFLSPLHSPDGAGPLAKRDCAADQPVFKTGRPWQPQGWKVRFLRRSVGLERAFCASEQAARRCQGGAEAQQRDLELLTRRLGGREPRLGATQDRRSFGARPAKKSMPLSSIAAVAIAVASSPCSRTQSAGRPPPGPRPGPGPGPARTRARPRAGRRHREAHPRDGRAARTRRLRRREPWRRGRRPAAAPPQRRRPPARSVRHGPRSGPRRAARHVCVRPHARARAARLARQGQTGPCGRSIVSRQPNAAQCLGLLRSTRTEARAARQDGQRRGGYVRRSIVAPARDGAQCWGMGVPECPRCALRRSGGPARQRQPPRQESTCRSSRSLGKDPVTAVSLGAVQPLYLEVLQHETSPHGTCRHCDGGVRRSHGG